MNCIQHISPLILTQRSKGRVTNIFHWRQQQREVAQIQVAYFNTHNTKLHYLLSSLPLPSLKKGQLFLMKNTPPPTIKAKAKREVFLISSYLFIVAGLLLKRHACSNLRRAKAFTMQTLFLKCYWYRGGFLSDPYIYGGGHQQKSP